MSNNYTEHTCIRATKATSKRVLSAGTTRPRSDTPHRLGKLEHFGKKTSVVKRPGDIDKASRNTVSTEAEQTLCAQDNRGRPAVQSHKQKICSSPRNITVYDMHHALKKLRWRERFF